MPLVNSQGLRGIMQTFKELVRLPLNQWNFVSFNNLSSAHLEALCILLGIPKSGSKTIKIKRLTNTVKVRIIIEFYLTRCDSVEQAINTLAHEYKTTELKSLCRQVGVFCSLSNKRAIAVSLTNWRTSCINKGTKAYQEAKSVLTKRPKQLSLF
jgi:hypothetical protein